MLWYSIQVGKRKTLSIAEYGRLVKGLRRRPLTAKTGVRFPYLLRLMKWQKPVKRLLPFLFSTDSFAIIMKSMCFAQIVPQEENKMEIFLAMILIWGLSVWSKKNARRAKEDRMPGPAQRTSGQSFQGRPSTSAAREEVQREVRQARTMSKPRKATAVPNKPRRQKLTREEEALKTRSRASSQACTYEAAYSKGKPDRVGGRGDYETVTPNGMERIRCGYCGAQNFVPVGSRNHYHCYFCWEKL